MLKALHTGDWHHSDIDNDATFPALQYLVEQAKLLNPSFIAVPGDLIRKRGHVSPNESYVLRNTVLALADIAPTIILPGNHDMSNRYDRVDAVKGLLGRLKEDMTTLHPQLFISTKPENFQIETKDGLVQIYTLPHPSKYAYLSKNTETDPSKLNEVLSSALQDILQGHDLHASQLSAGITKVMLGHGTIAGGLTDSEKIMTTENDLAIDRSWLPVHMDAIMYAHLHKRQSVAEAFYCGAIAPLTFGQEKMVPSFEMWEFPAGQPVTHRPVEIPVAHQLFTVEIKQDKFEGAVDPTAVVMSIVEPMGMAGARVRVRVEISREKAGLFNKSAVEEYLDAKQVYDHKIGVDTIDAINVRAEDMSQEQGMNDMLDTWASLDEDRGDSLDLMKEIESQVVANIPIEQMSKLSSVDYDITAIKATNFKPLIDVDIQTAKLGRITCIIGDNHVGKSQLAEIERFALWKQLRDGTTLDNAIRKGTRSATVIVEFIDMNNNKKYQVKRTLKLSKNGTASGDLVFSEQVGEEFKPLNEGTEGETQTNIEERVGTYAMYRATRFGSQSDIDFLCSLPPAKMKDTIQEALNFTQFEVRKEVAKKELDILQNAYDHATANLGPMKQRLLQEPTLRDQIGIVEEVKKGLDTSIADYQSQIASTQVKIDNIQEVSSEITRLQNLITEKNGLIATENSALTSAKNILGQVEAAKTGLQTIETLRTEIGTLTADRQVLLDAIEKDDVVLNGLRDEYSKLLPEKTNLETAIGAVKRTAENEIFNHNAKIDRCKDALARETKTAQLAKDVPCAEMDINSECSLLENANKAASEAVRLQAELTEIESTPPDTTEWDKTRQTLEGDLKVTTDTIVAINAKGDELRVPADERKKQSNEKYLSITTKQTALNLELTKGWDKVQEQILTAEANSTNATNNIARIEQEKVGVEGQLTKLSAEGTDISSLTATINELSAFLSASQGQHSMEVNKLAGLNQGLQQIEDTKREIEKIEGLNTSGLARIKAYMQYIAATGRDGIPYLLMEKALPRFEEYANGFLCVDEGFATTLRVKIAAVKDTQSGVSKNVPHTTFVDELGEFPLGEASGFQRTALGYALRAGLAQIQAQSAGIKIRHSIFDEGWGTFNEANLPLAQRMVQKLGEAFGRFIYITHIPALQEVADTIIEVTAVDGGAEITII